MLNKEAKFRIKRNLALREDHPMDSLLQEKPDAES